MEQPEIIPDSIREPDLKRRILAFCHAILVLLCAYALIYALYGVFDHNGYPLVYLLGVIALFALTAVFGLLSGGKLNAHAIAALLFGLIAGLFVWINGGISLVGFAYLNVTALSYTFFVLALFGNHNRVFTGGVLLLDLVKATFVYPFLSFAALFTSLFQRTKGSRKFGRGVLFVFVGIVIALVLGAIAVALLSYDPKFKAIFTFDWDWDELPNVLVRVIFTVPLAALLFGAFTSSHKRKLPNLSTPEQAEAIGTSMRKIPAVMLLIPAAALLIIYGLFFFTQWDTYMGAFSGVLPESFTAAEYARSGFFELCAVAAINAILAVVLSLFMKQTARVSVVLKKLANTLLALATLILIATALSKMFLYIKRFDLTVARLIASTILVLIAIGYVVSLLAQWMKRVKVMPVLIVCVAALLLVVPFLNVRGRIAKYNVDQYLLREEQHVAENSIDVDYLYGELGSAGVPDALRLLHSGKLPNGSAALLKDHLKHLYWDLSERNVFDRSLADARALKALEEAFGE